MQTLNRLRKRNSACFPSYAESRLRIIKDWKTEGDCLERGR